MKAEAVTLVVVLLAGCNAILGNEPANGIDENFDRLDGGGATREGSSIVGTDAADSCSGVCPTVLATGIEGTPRALVVDATNVYFTSGMEIRRVGRDGSGLTTWLTDLNDTRGLARWGDDLLFAQGSSAVVGRAKTADATARSNSDVAPGKDHAYRALAVGGDRLYVTDVVAHDVFRYDLLNWSAAPVAVFSGTNEEPWDVVAASGDVYIALRRGCAANGAIVRSQGTPFSNFADNERCPQGVAADDANTVYWASGGPGGAIRKKATGSFAQASTLASDQANPVAIAVDGTFVYWANAGTDGKADGSIRRAKRDDGSGMQVLASDVSSPVALALDAGSIYWLEAGSHRLMKLAK
jgi:hypothetical protein